MILPSPIAASISSATALAEELERYRVLSRERLADVMVDFPGGGALGLAEFLVARGELTPFQAERTLSGQAHALLVGPYRILEPHHIGAFGPIFRASRDSNDFALRVLPLRSLWQAKLAKPLVRTLATLNSVPAVVPLIDADSANGSHYLAWPHVDGELLSEFVPSNGPFDPARTIALLTRLASALASCHSCQVVHGLLTPQAVCLQRDGSPLLLEVGAGMLLAQNLASEDSLFDTMSSSIAVSGAFDFAAPEWVANPAKPTAAADQYSLGAIGCFVLTGEPPVHGRPPRWAPTVPRELVGILNRMLEADPVDRYSSVNEVWAALMDLEGASDHLLIEHDPSEHASRHSGSRTDASGAGELDWPTADEMIRPVERDNTDASIHFDLPPPPVEESIPAEMYVAHEARETPPPAQWVTTTHLRTEPTPPPQSRFLDSKPRGEAIAPPPKLPAAPLPPLEGDRPSSGSWTSATSKPASTSPSKERPSGSVLWNKMKRKVMFWQTPGDTVHLSVFGPQSAAHSETPRLTVFLHSASAAESVGTLARAFHHDAVLLASGPLTQNVTRGSRLDVHVAIAHMSVTNPLGGFAWQGQPYRLTFDFVVPWEAPLGTARGVISIGSSETRIGKLEFGIPVRDGNG